MTKLVVRKVRIKAEPAAKTDGAKYRVTGGVLDREERILKKLLK